MKQQPLQRRQDWIRGRREKRKLARLARARRQVLRYSLLLFMIAVGICGFTQLPWTIDDLQDDVWIHGNKVVSDLQIRKALSAALNQPVYQLDPRELSKSVCKLPAVRYAFVRRSVLPQPQIRVEVMEEFPWATYSPSPEEPAVGVIAETGRYIPVHDFPGVVQPPLRLCGDKSLKLSPGEISQWDNWVRLIEAQTGQPVKLVDMRKPGAVQAFSGGFELHLGAVDSSLNRRIGRLSSVMPVVANLQEELRYIDLSLDSNIPLKVDKKGSGKSTKNPTAATSGTQTAPVSAPAPSTASGGTQLPM